MRRGAGPLTERDLAAIRGMRHTLAALGVGADAYMRAASAAVRHAAATLGPISKVAAAAVAFDAAPRHRELPAPDDTRDWLDRHLGEATPPEVALYQALRGRGRPAALLPRTRPFSVSPYSRVRAAMMRRAVQRARTEARARRRGGVTLPGERLGYTGAVDAYRYSDAFTWTGGL